MIKNNYFILILLTIFLLIGLGAELSLTENIPSDIFEIINISELLGIQSMNITGTGIDYVETLFGEEIQARLIFSQENASVNLNGTIFSNIVPQNVSNHPTYLWLNENGSLIEADFTVNENGGIYVFNNTKIYAPPNSRVMFENGEINIKVLNGTFEQLPSFIDSNYSYLINIFGENITLPDGSVLKGTLSFLNGNTFVGTKNLLETTINGVAITSPYSTLKDKVNVFFDGEKKEVGSYVSFDLDKKRIIASNNGEGSFKLEFKKGNPFIDMGNEAGAPFLSLEIKNSLVQIQNRESDNLIPKIEVTGRELQLLSPTSPTAKLDIFENQVRIIDGNAEIGTYVSAKITKESINKDVSVEVRKSNIPGDSVPLEIEVSEANNVIFVDGYGRAAAFNMKELDRTKPEIKIGEKGFMLGQQGTYSPFRVTYNHLEEGGVERTIGKELNFGLIGSENKQTLLKNMIDFSETLTPETRESLDSIRISDDIGKDMPLFGSMAAGYAGFKGDINLMSSAVAYATFRHEAAHERHYAIIREENTILGLIFRVIKQEIKEPLREGETFNQKWTKVSEGYLTKCWIKDGNWYWVGDETYYGPKYGFMRPYGCFNIFEDVATFVEAAVEPYWFRDLMNPASPRYNERYKKKLDLLYEFKFISKAEYNRVLEAGGTI